MPPTATIDDLKAYEKKVEKGQITPENFPACPRCEVDSGYFKIHAYRERGFLIIVDMFVKGIKSVLVRFRCPGCGKTFTYYPDFALPHKRYTTASITCFSKKYLTTEDTYEKAVMVNGERGVPGYDDGYKTLAPSTVHRWITSLSSLEITTQKALDLILQQNPASSLCRDLSKWLPQRCKYKNEERKRSLISCFRLLAIEAVFFVSFGCSVFTKLAISSAFS